MKIFKLGKKRSKVENGYSVDPHSLKKLGVLQNKINYNFKDVCLLLEALTHPSYDLKKSDTRHNQRLEFLGDSVLGCILANWLYVNFPDYEEGELSKKKSLLAHGRHLSGIAQEIGLEQFLITGKSELGKNGKLRDAVLEDALEALIGAIYVDSGYDAVARVVHDWTDIFENTIRLKSNAFNPKGRLQEYTQSLINKPRICYRVIRQSGPDHMKEFEVELKLDDQTISKGIGRSKKKAEENAAAQALADLLEE